MTFGDFIKDELSSILLQILCAIILTIYLCSLSLDDLEALHYKKMARKILFSEILFFLLILLIFNTQITFAFFFSFTIHLSVLALQITVELVSKNFFANL